MCYLQGGSCRLTTAVCRHSMPLSRAGVVERETAGSVRCAVGPGSRCLSLEDYVTAMRITRGMDYGVRLLSRIQEEYRRWPDHARAVSAGLEHTGGVITGAAAIMAAVFVSFAAVDLVVIKAVGIGMGVAA